MSQKQLIGIVVDQDGTVRFDDGCPDQLRNTIIAHLTDNGHAHERVAGTRHVRIINWTAGKAL